MEELGLRRTEDDGRGIVSKMKGNSDWMDEETAKMVTKTSKGKMKKKKEIEDKMKKKSFEFRKKGKLTKKEEKELERTQTNIFDWVKKAWSRNKRMK